MSNAALLLISFVLLLLFSICIALSVNADCKVHDIKSKSAFTDVAFFFGWIGFIFYMCSRGKAKGKPRFAVAVKIVPKAAFPFVPFAKVILFILKNGRILQPLNRKASDF